ncbi:hypothetical protein GCM10011390_45580 [Aureimonas endophytica]|uniref:Lipoprotein n=1 Tax=Aureimonas endophytica TaxID=2027858 RepID=A0A917EBC4_9HYPH|nr:hypothetical protein [Aureimonas endophytica]GGE21168.1 hypothetical protein GCM10011390_45580 [Aureimonas endophytica]
MRRLLFLLAIVSAGALAACQTNGNSSDGITYSKSNANKAKTDDPIAALKKY